MAWPAAVLWALVVPLMLMSGPWLLYMMFLANVFMSIQMLPGDGGANLLPVTVYALALIGKIALTRGNALQAAEAALDIKRMGPFTAFVVYSLMSAVLLPRIFAGQVEVVPVSGASLDGPSLVYPRAGNVTQSGYILVSYLTALSFSVIGSREDARRHFLMAMLWFAIAMIVTGLLDLVLSRLGLSSLLSPFRTAGYEMLTDVEAAGVKRVVGLTPEASTFGSLNLAAAAALLLLRPLYQRGRRRTFATLAMLGAGLMALLSTSSTAYAGGGVLALVYGFDLISRALGQKSEGRQTVSTEVALVACVVFVIAAIVIFSPNTAAPFFDLLNKIVFDKSNSVSYYQRSMWTNIGLHAFADSSWLGVGFGSIRTSNWAVSIIASTGVIGAAMIFGFMAQKILSPMPGLDPRARAFRWGLKLWMLPVLTMSLLAGTIPDIGMLMAATLGLLSAGPSSIRVAVLANPPERNYPSPELGHPHF